MRTKLQLAIWMQQDGKLRQAFRDYLPLPVEEYYRRGKEIFLHLDSVLDQRLLDEVYAGYKGS